MRVCHRFESRQLKAAEKNYPVHDKEPLNMKYALVKFRVHLLGSLSLLLSIPIKRIYAR